MAMGNYTTKTIVFIFLIGAVCFTSIRLVNITVELEEVRRTRQRSQFVSSPNCIDHFAHITPSQVLQPSSAYQYTSFPQYQRSLVDCLGIFEGNTKSIKRAQLLTRTVKYRMPGDHDIYNEARDCRTFLSKYGYADHVVSQEEREFPVAYTILAYKDIAQLNLLLKAIYRQHNLYCVHIDGNSDSSVHMAARAVADCFQNVFIASKTEHVVYGGFSRLQADLNCMHDLLVSNYTNWKYVINLPSQEYPLKTNKEIVKILRIYNGANDIEGITGTRMLSGRFIQKHVYKKHYNNIIITSTSEKNPPPPHNITVIKGSAYGVFSRAFVDYVLNDKIAKDLLKWCRDIKSPDEYFWATLHHNPSLNVPGSYAGHPDDKPWLATYATWSPEPCTGSYLRGICLYNIGDLPVLANRPELFANKFIMASAPLALMCMEEWIHNKTLSPLPFKNIYYRNLPFIKK